MIQSRGAAVDRASHNATQPNTCEHNSEHDRERRRRRSDIQAQKPEPNHFQRKKNAARPKADEKQTPRWQITCIEAQRKCSVWNKRAGVALDSCDQQSDRCSNANRQTRSYSGAMKPKRCNEITFAEHGAGYCA